MRSEPSAVKLAVGLGNPGGQYQATRHNAGYWWLDALARQYAGTFATAAKFQGLTAEVRIHGTSVRLLKPVTFMNHSGRSVAALARFYRIPVTSVLIVHDEIDLPAGQVRLKRGGGDGGHRGLRDIIPTIGADFLRLRIGVGRPAHREDVVGYVLKQPRAEEQAAIEMGLERALDQAAAIFSGDTKLAMNSLHRAQAPAADAC